MRKKRKNSNWKAVLIVGIIFIIVGTITYLTHSYILENKTNNDTKEKNDIVESKDNDEDNNNTSTNDEEKKEEVKETENFKDQEGNDVKISGDKIVSATGFAGASNYKFYLRNGELYFRNISNEENDEELIATGVKDLYLENKEVTAELLPDGKIVKENNYITYK